jgi:CBS domain-containing protein
MIIKEILKQKGDKVFSVQPEDTAIEAIKKLNDLGIGALIVLKGEDVEGILSERDLLASFQRCNEGCPVSEVMTAKHKMIVASEEDDIEYAMHIFTNNRIRHLPVMTEGKLVGIISIGDAVKAQIKHTEFENKMLRDYISTGY